MYPVLILRCEFLCLVILAVLSFVSRYYGVNNKHSSYRKILVFAIMHVIFDIITVLTVNNLDKVPSYVNLICHAFFYISAILYSWQLVCYVLQQIYPKYAKKLYFIGHLIGTIYILLLPILKIDYVKVNGTYSSSGLGAYVGYGIAFLFFISALFIMFTHLNQISASKKLILIPIICVLIVAEFFQIFFKSLLFTGGALTLVSLGLFISLENPIESFKKKAMTDALTGVLSRSTYEDNIKKLNKQFEINPNDDYTFAFCDLNDLRNVNNHFGHDEGDNYISLIANSIKNCKMLVTFIV